uniref:V-type ATP synthase subunit F n=1 Tax=candidate division WOR-3 bacterium TaxID=2052148 RepID=A0A7V3ZZ49_UNCW3
MKRVICLGKYETVFPLKAIGMEYRVCNTGEEAREALKSLISQNYGLIFIEEDYFQSVKDIVDSLKEQAYPAVTFIPGAGGSTGQAREKLRAILLRAIGIDIF